MATHVEDGTGDKLDRSMFDGMIRGQDYVYSDLFIQKMAKQEGAKVKAINKAEDEETKMRLLRDFMRIGDEVDFSWSMPLFAEYVRYFTQSSPHWSRAERASTIHSALTAATIGLQSENRDGLLCRPQRIHPERLARYAFRTPDLNSSLADRIPVNPITMP